VTEARLSLLSECFFADIVQSLEDLLDSFDNWFMCDEIDEIIESLTDHPTPLFPDLDILAPSDEPEDQPEEYAGQLAVFLPPWPATTSEIRVAVMPPSAGHVPTALRSGQLGVLVAFPLLFDAIAFVHVMTACLRSSNRRVLLKRDPCRHAGIRSYREVTLS
jgi:hypothetical protein